MSVGMRRLCLLDRGLLAGTIVGTDPRGVGERLREFLARTSLSEINMILYFHRAFLKELRTRMKP